MKTLYWDWETLPALVYTFETRNAFIGLDQIVEPGRAVCFGAQWGDTGKTMFFSEWRHGRAGMLQAAWDLLDEADIVAAYNGDSFDTKIFNGEVIEKGPYAPFQSIDLYKVVKANFRLQSHKLQYVAEHLGVGSKVSHHGFRLWREVIEGDRKAQALMERYCKQDVKLLPRVYAKLQPWIKTHPNVALYNDIEGCPNCGGSNLEKRGFRYTRISAYQRYHCNDCGAWPSGGKRIRGVDIR